MHCPAAHGPDWRNLSLKCYFSSICSQVFCVCWGCGFRLESSQDVFKFKDQWCRYRAILQGCWLITEGIYQTRRRAGIQARAWSDPLSWPRIHRVSVVEIWLSVAGKPRHGWSGAEERPRLGFNQAKITRFCETHQSSSSNGWAGLMPPSCASRKILREGECHVQVLCWLNGIYNKFITALADYRWFFLE